ncbi:Chloramphenicol-sensitive protein RarD [Pseudomonas sp. OF001]|uniref:EamA family transporter RarD n=1 Tax=Pseudomonas sp. OF001 TaxID=2772300 RepID=UPI001918EF7B|nr:EamA family transporter RarD [Pseudomonas sp. OF001]CAD5379208.1 Chloramphenicol-sensitive protein RarD [Pseudomonas sp. OF001]
MNTPSPGNTSAGILLNVLSSILFAVMYAYTGLLAPLSGEEIYGWRTLLTVPCLTLLLLATDAWDEVRSIGRRLRHESLFWAKRLLSAFLLGIQVWLFMWAPLNGHALDVSLGYFLLPITAAMVGRFAFHERITPLQLLACGLAGIGVINEFTVVGRVSWPTLLVCLGYPLYFYLRRVIGTNNLGGLWCDMTLSLPLSLFFIWKGGMVLSGADGAAHLPLLIVGLGALSASALALSALSAPRLNLTLFGLLSYVEPVLLVLASLLLGESIAPSQWPTYIAIWLAILVLIMDGIRSLLRQRWRGRPAAGESARAADRDAG